MDEITQRLHDYIQEGSAFCHKNNAMGDANQCESNRVNKVTVDFIGMLQWFPVGRGQW